MLRLTEEQLLELERKRQSWNLPGVRTHRSSDPNPAKLPDLPPGTPQPPAKPYAKRRGPGRQRKRSEIEILLEQQLVLLPELPKFEREYKHIANREFRLDFAWPERRIGIEVQGMVHRIKGRFKNDIEKRALGLLAGWRILEVGGAEIRAGLAARWIVELWHQQPRNP